MVMLLVCLTLTPTAAFVAPTLGIARPPASMAVAARSLPIAVARSPAASMSMMIPPDADGAGMTSLVVNAAIFFLVISIASKLAFPDALGDSFGGEDAAASPDSSTDAGVGGFGWLQADLRMPLPSWAELEQACHPVGNHNGWHMYLCSSKQQGGRLEKCEVSEDFTKYYGQTVYVCAGGRADGRFSG